MNIIGVTASPRKEGNTAWIVNKILEGAKEQGAETQSWYFSDLDIKPCQGCLCCRKGDGDRGCIVNDDMQKLYGAIEPADAIVLGSPIYMGQMSAQAKIFTDRLFAQISPRFSPHYRERAVKKKLVLVFNQGNPDPGMFQVYIDYTKHIFQLWMNLPRPSAYRRKARLGQRPGRYSSYARSVLALCRAGLPRMLPSWRWLP